MGWLDWLRPSWTSCGLDVPLDGLPEYQRDEDFAEFVRGGFGNVLTALAGPPRKILTVAVLGSIYSALKPLENHEVKRALDDSLGAWNVMSAFHDCSTEFRYDTANDPDLIIRDYASQINDRGIAWTSSGRVAWNGRTRTRWVIYCWSQWTWTNGNLPNAPRHDLLRRVLCHELGHVMIGSAHRSPSGPPSIMEYPLSKRALTVMKIDIDDAIRKRGRR